VIYRGPLALEPLREGDAVVSERIEAGGDDRRGREVTQIVGAKRHCEGFVRVGRTPEVLLEEPPHVRAGEKGTVGVLAVGIGLEVVARDRVQQELAGWLYELAELAGVQRRRERERPARTGAGDAEPVGVAAERRRVARDPRDGRGRLVDRNNGKGCSGASR